MAEFITDVFLAIARDSDISTFILETTYKGSDANLWESSWRNKAKRFIGFKRDPHDDYIVTDITVISEDKDVPDDYAGLLITSDSKEKGLRKHIVCYKRDSRKTSKFGITEINVINQSKSELVPAQFTAVNGEINDLLIVFKSKELPSQNAPPQPAPRTNANPVVATQQLQSASPQSPLAGIDGVPFQINPKYNTNSSRTDPLMSEISKLSIDDLLQKEKGTVQDVDVKNQVHFVPDFDVSVL